MTDIINLAIQFWFILGQKFFYISKNLNHKRTEIAQNFIFLEKPLSRTYTSLKNKKSRQIRFFKGPQDKISFELYSILVNEQNFLLLIKLIKSLKSKQLEIARKKISKSILVTCLYPTRNKILFNWLENFFLTKNFTLKFDFLNNQIIKGYYLKFLRTYLIQFLIWTIVSKKEGKVFSKSKKSFSNEFVKFTFYFNNKSLKNFLMEQADRFLSFLRTTFIYKDRFCKKGVKYTFYIGLKLFIMLCQEESSILIEFKHSFFQNVIIFSSYLILTISKIFNPLGLIFSKNKSPLKHRFLPEIRKNYLQYLFVILLEIFKNHIFYKLVYFSNVKSDIFQKTHDKKLKNLKIIELLEDNLRISFWRLFSFLGLFEYFKLKEKLSFRFLTSISEKGIDLNSKKLKFRVEKFLIFTYKRKIFKLATDLIPLNVHSSIGIYSFYTIIYQLNFIMDVRQMICLLIASILMVISSQENPCIFEEKFLLLNRVLNKKNQINIFEEENGDCNRVCKDICNYFTNTKYHLFGLQYKTGLSKIYERSSMDLLEYSRIKSNTYRNSYGKGERKYTEFKEFFRDKYATCKINGKIKIVNSKNFSKFKKDNISSIYQKRFKNF